jgi:hypothetical protein
LCSSRWIWMAEPKSCFAHSRTLERISKIQLNKGQIDRDEDRFVAALHAQSEQVHDCLQGQKAQEQINAEAQKPELLRRCVRDVVESQLRDDIVTKSCDADACVRAWRGTVQDGRFSCQHPVMKAHVPRMLQPPRAIHSTSQPCIPRNHIQRHVSDRSLCKLGS